MVSRVAGPSLSVAALLTRDEQAAKAAGYTVGRYKVGSGQVVRILDADNGWIVFDPRNDDAQAFRLMLKLNLVAHLVRFGTKGKTPAEIREFITDKAVERYRGY